MLTLMSHYFKAFQKRFPSYLFVAADVDAEPNA
jgi:hypothetical protein